MSNDSYKLHVLEVVERVRPEQSVELVRVDRREVLLGPQAGHVDGVLAVGEDLLVLRLARVRRRRAAERPALLVGGHPFLDLEVKFLCLLLLHGVELGRPPPLPRRRV